MKEKIDAILAEIEGLKDLKAQEVEAARVRLLGKKGEITQLFDEFRGVAPEMKREFGQKLNQLKQAAAAKIEELKAAAESQQAASAPSFDCTLPGDPVALGSRHPVSIAREEIVEIFRKFGYDVAEGPEIEDDYHVFEALNFPPEHPARDMQDTFFVTSGHNPVLLRTHTSSVQVRAMEKLPLPIRIVCPGRVFRNEAISARAHCIFHQVEGLYIDEGVTFADMKQAILLFAREMFGPETKIRMRPSYFPFTEPSAEVDLQCFKCGGKGCPLCKGEGWIEMLGSGIVHPQVLINCGIDPEEYSGFAFGIGLERIAMMRYNIDDMRLLYENDQRFLAQFR